MKMLMQLAISPRVMVPVVKRSSLQNRERTGVPARGGGSDRMQALNFVTGLMRAKLSIAG